MSDSNAYTVPRPARDFFAEPAGALIKTTLVDFPGRVASSLFLKGCNLRCPYCYNGELVTPPTEKNRGSAVSAGSTADTNHLATLRDVLAHLEKRRNVLTGFVISGGEPLLFPHLAELITEAKKLGYKIKLDTNGTLPDRLAAIMQNPATEPDFIAMDIKTAPERYDLLAPHTTRPESNAITSADNAIAPATDAPAANATDLARKLAASARLIATLPADAREWRTVLVPPLVTRKDISAMAALLPADASWQFAPFRNENCLDARYNAVAPYTDAQATELVSYAQTLIAGARLR